MSVGEPDYNHPASLIEITISIFVSIFTGSGREKGHCSGCQEARWYETKRHLRSKSPNKAKPSVQPPLLLSSQRQTEPIGSKRRRWCVAGEVVQNRPLWRLSTNERHRFCKLDQSEQGKRRGGEAQNIQGSHEVSLHPKQGPVPAHRQHLKRELENIFYCLIFFGQFNSIQHFKFFFEITAI